MRDKLFCIAAIGFLSLATTACTEMFRSDAENFSRQADRSRQRALQSMKLSSAQQPAGKAVAGDTLLKLLSGKSHIREYRKRIDDARPYVTTYDYFGPDGTFIVRDTHGRRTAEYQEMGKWTVNGGVLCIVVPSYVDKKCYSIRIEPAGKIQYWIHNPGDPFDGLASAGVSIVRPGLQEPEYISDPADFR
jgi:hypothetical protein